jgi:hypothetical protein
VAARCPLKADSNDNARFSRGGTVSRLSDRDRSAAAEADPLQWSLPRNFDGYVGLDVGFERDRPAAEQAGTAPALRDGLLMNDA